MINIDIYFSNSYSETIDAIIEEEIIIWAEVKDQGEYQQEKHL